MPPATKPVIFCVPASLDLAEMFDTSDRDYAAWFLDLLHRKLLSWQVDRRGYSRLKRDYITRFIPRQRFTSIRVTLERHGVVCVNRSYCTGEYSIGYRLDPKYWESKQVECRNQGLARKIRAYHEEQERRLLPVHRWLRSRLSEIEFNYKRAETIIGTMVPDTGSPTHVFDYRVLMRELAKRFRHKSRLYLKVDVYGRLHTPGNRSRPGKE
jgi:hypothetical protein